MNFNLFLFMALLFSSFGFAWLPMEKRLPHWLTHTVFQHFGTGILVSTAMIHLLGPALEAMPGDYQLPLLFCSMSLFTMLVIEIASIRMIREHTHRHGQAQCDISPDELSQLNQPEPGHSTIEKFDRAALLSLFIMETGIVIHSIFIGASLGVTTPSWGLTTAILIHQIFEGLGLGSRLLSLQVSQGIAFILVLIFAASTPLGLVIGWVATSSQSYDYAKGVCNAIAAGVVLYTGVVELMAGEVLYSKDIMTAPTSKVVLALVSMFVGGAIMAILGIWI